LAHLTLKLTGFSKLNLKILISFSLPGPPGVVGRERREEEQKGTGKEGQNKTD